MINGDAESRSHWFAYALGTTATAVALTKTGVATTKTAVQKSVTIVPNTMNTMQSSRLAQILPYGPRTQVALPGGVPFSVITGPVLKENLFMQAEKLPDSGGGLKGPVKPVSNINEFFDMKFGKALKSSLSKTNVQYDVQSIYKVSKKR